MDNLTEKIRAGNGMDDLMVHLETLIHQKYNGMDHQEYFKRVNEFTNRVKSNNPDWQRYKFLHLLINSTLDEKADLYDFPNQEDSVQKFIESL